MSYNKEGNIISKPSKTLSKYRANKKKQKRTNLWLFFSTVLIISIATEATLNEVGLIRTIIFGKEEVNWRYAIHFGPIEDYIKKYPTGVHIKEAKEKLEYEVWRNAFVYGTLESYKNYLTEYPNGKYLEKAEENYEWKNAERINTIQSYENYLFKYPEGKYSKDIKEEILTWEKAVYTNTIIHFKNYISKYPKGEFVDKALQKFSEKGIKYYIIEVDFKNLSNYRYATIHDHKELTYIEPRIRIISTEDNEVEISYKSKNPSGFIEKFSRSDDRIRNNEIIKERFHLNKGVNKFRYIKGWGHKQGEWRQGTYEFIFYIDNNEYYTQTMTVK